MMDSAGSQPYRSFAVIGQLGESDDGVYMIGLREQPTDGGWGIIFMEADENPDEQDVAMGMDSYCIVVDPTQATHYGGIIAFVIGPPLTRDNPTLRIHFSSEAAISLSVDPVLSLALNLDGEEIGRLRDGLSRILASGPIGQVSEDV